MVRSSYPKKMSDHQISLLEQALRQITKIDPASWNDIPLDLRPSFARYMCPDAWTGRPNVLTLRDAALLIIRDAVARIGEFGEEKLIAGAPSHM